MRFEWFAKQFTAIFASDSPLELLPDIDKKFVQQYCRLSGELIGETDHTFVIGEVTADGVPVEGHLVHVYKAHWLQWAPINRFIPKKTGWLATQDIEPLVRETSGADESATFVPDGGAVEAKIITQTDASWIVYGARTAARHLPKEFCYVPKDSWMLEEHPILDEPEGILGYYFNNGGLTNQKMTLIGLFARAQEYNKPLILPKMSLKDIKSDTEIPISFSEIFQEEPLIQVAAKHGIELRLEDPARFRIGGWDYFHYGAGRVAHRAYHLAETFPDTAIVSDVVKSLVPTRRVAELVERVQRQLLQEDISLSVQLRVEKDWVWHCKYNLAPQVTEPEDFDLTFDQILGKIARSLPSERRVLGICDEEATPQSKEVMKAVAHASFGIQLVFKSDFLTSDEIAELNVLDRANLDFELAASTRHFVGITRSTFSNFVTMRKAIARERPVDTDYIYNNTGEELSLRRDNGARSHPRGATSLS